MSANDTRQQIMALADTLNQQRTALLETIRQINLGIATLVQKADDLLPVVAAEVPQGKEPIKINYTTHSPSPADIAAIVSPPSRTCGECGEAGHDKRNCPNLHEVKVEKKQKIEKKSGRKPLSEERKAALRETLKKARAARGKGKSR